MGLDLWCGCYVFVIILFNVFFKMSDIFLLSRVIRGKIGGFIKMWVALLNNFKYPSTPFLL